MDLTAITLTELRNVVAIAEGDLRATSLETLRHQVAAGIGCRRLPALAIASLVTASTVVARPFKKPAPYRRIGLGWRRSFPDEAGVQALAAFIRAQVPGAAQTVRAADSAA